jgi:hypothetical protein
MKNFLFDFLDLLKILYSNLIFITSLVVMFVVADIHIFTHGLGK